MQNKKGGEEEGQQPLQVYLQPPVSWFTVPLMLIITT